MGQRDHVDAGLGDELGHTALVVGRALTEAHAMAGGRPMCEPGEHGPARSLEAVDRRIEGLVGVQVDGRADVTGHVEQHVGGLARVAIEVRTATDDVGAGRHRVAAGARAGRRRRFR